MSQTVRPYACFLYFVIGCLFQQKMTNISWSVQIGGGSRLVYIVLYFSSKSGTHQTVRQKYVLLSVVLAEMLNLSICYTFLKCIICHKIYNLWFPVSVMFMFFVMSYLLHQQTILVCMPFYWTADDIWISMSLLLSDNIFKFMQNDKDMFMESLICRLDDDCDKLLICKLDLECKKTLHFDSEVSMPQVSIYNLNHMSPFCLPLLV